MLNNKKVEERLVSLENYANGIQGEFMAFKREIYEALNSDKNADLRKVLIKATEPFKMSDEYVKSLGEFISSEKHRPEAKQNPKTL